MLKKKTMKVFGEFGLAKIEGRWWVGESYRKRKRGREITRLREV